MIHLRKSGLYGDLERLILRWGRLLHEEYNQTQPGGRTQRRDHECELCV